MDEIDLGNGYTAEWCGWHPDRKLNPQYENLPDVEKLVLLISCPHGNKGGCHVKQKEHQAEYEELFKNSANWWDLVSEDPLEISPSVQFLTPKCCHGFIRQGKWVNA